MITNNDHTIRVATYARVSTQEQATEGTSLDFQDNQLKTYCQSQGWVISNSYVDPGYSGKDDNRPGLKQLLTDARFNLFKKVVVCKLDRMARNLRLMLSIEAQLREYQVSFTSIKESIDTSTSTGKMIFQMFGMVAEWERETIIERTKAGRLQRYKEGRWAGGKVPYGYKYNRDTKKLEINEDEAHIVRRIYSSYRKGSSLRGIAEMLNAEKVAARGKHGKGWRQTAVRQLILNPMYNGTQIVNRYCHITSINKIDLDNTIKINVPALVSDKVWQTAQDRLSTNKHNKPKKRGEFILQGIISCGECGYAFRAERVHNRRYYVCRGRMKDKHLDGSERCKTPHIRAEYLENEVITRVNEILDDPNKLFDAISETIATLTNRADELNARIKPIEDQLAHITKQKAKLADDWIFTNMDRAKYVELQNMLESEETRLKAIKSFNDPSQTEELLRTKAQLKLWKNHLKEMQWNTEDEDGNMVRLVNRPHEFAKSVVSLGDNTLFDFLGFPTSPRQFLDAIQARLVVFYDHVEVNVLVPIRPIEIQKCTSTNERGRERKAYGIISVQALR